MSRDEFATRLLNWFDANGRHDLPWQHPRAPYRVWISEIMLQQTQVATVIGYFERFVARFPDIETLAMASLDDVLALWSGLGYYSRARNLHRAAQLCLQLHDAQLPDSVDALLALPGIGRSTAAAILAQAHAQRVAILDGNVKRVLARHAGIAGYPGDAPVERMLWAEAERRLPHERLPDYTQALMDFGATLCTSRAPQCSRCPLRDDCSAFTTDRVAALPTPKPKRTSPLRSVCMLVLVDATGNVLFERRPPVGIWGGMLGLPECADVVGCIDTAARLALPRAPAQVGECYRHVFTHFKLDIVPVVVAVDRVDRVAEATHVWHAQSQFADLALPTAIRRVLDQALRSSTP